MYSKTTENYQLPQWIGSDHPDFRTDINEAFEKIDSVMKGNSGDYSSLKEQVEAISTNMVTINEEFEKIKKTVDQLENLEDNPTFQALATQVDQLNKDYADLQTAVATNTGDITTLKSGLSTLESTVNTLKTVVDGHTNTLSNHTESIATLQQAVSDINTNIQELQTDVGNLKVSQSQQDTKITNLETWKTETDAKLESLESGEGTNSTDIAALETKYNNLSTSVDNLSERTSTAENNISTNTTDISTLKGQYSSAQSQINELKTYTTEEATKLIALTTQVANMDDEFNRRIGSVEAKNITQDTELQSQDARIEALEDSIVMIQDGKGIFASGVFHITEPTGTVISDTITLTFLNNGFIIGQLNKSATDSYLNSKVNRVYDLTVGDVISGLTEEEFSRIKFLITSNLRVPTYYVDLANSLSYFYSNYLSGSGMPIYTVGVTTHDNIEGNFAFPFFAGFWEFKTDTNTLEEINDDLTVEQKKSLGKEI